MSSGLKHVRLNVAQSSVSRRRLSPSKSRGYPADIPASCQAPRGSPTMKYHSGSYRLTGDDYGPVFPAEFRKLGLFWCYLPISLIWARLGMFNSRTGPDIGISSPSPGCLSPGSEEAGAVPLYSFFPSRVRIRSFFAIAASAALRTCSFISSKSRGSVSTTFFTGV